MVWAYEARRIRLQEGSRRGGVSGDRKWSIALVVCAGSGFEIGESLKGHECFLHPSVAQRSCTLLFANGVGNVAGKCGVCCNGKSNSICSTGSFCSTIPIRSTPCNRGPWRNESHTPGRNPRDFSSHRHSFVRHSQSWRHVRN